VVNFFTPKGTKILNRVHNVEAENLSLPHPLCPLCKFSFVFSVVNSSIPKTLQQSKCMAYHAPTILERKYKSVIYVL